MLERTGAITNEVLEPITFVLAYPTILSIPGVSGIFPHAAHNYKH